MASLGLLLGVLLAVVAPTPVSPEGWLKIDDDSAAVRKAAPRASFAYRLDVSPDGDVIDCKLEPEFGSSDFQAETCALLSKSVRFNPATDNQGNKVYGVYRGRFLGLLKPRRSAFEKAMQIKTDILNDSNLIVAVNALPPGTENPALVTVSLLVDAEGKVQDCAVNSSIFPKDLQSVACRQAVENLKPRPGKDIFGRWTNTIQNAAVLIELEATLLKGRWSMSPIFEDKGRTHISGFIQP